MLVPGRLVAEKSCHMTHTTGARIMATAHTSYVVSPGGTELLRCSSYQPPWARHWFHQVEMEAVVEE